MIVANTQAIGREIWERSTRTLLATAGDRLALHSNQWRGGEVGSSFEVDTLEVTEVDADGRIVAAIILAPDDRRAASAELAERYAASDASESRRASRLELLRALREHDLDRVRAGLPDGFVYHDHRRIGAGRLAGEEYLAWLAGLFEQSADAIIEPLYIIAIGECGALEMAHMFGTLAASGGDIESVYLRLFVYRGDRMIGMELFEPEDLDVARARFAALWAAGAGEA